jgi:hypothetical protein
MVEYHVGNGMFGTIYAGRLNKDHSKWVDKTDVTDEAIMCVAEYLMLEAMNNGLTETNRFWTLPDGRTVELKVITKEATV